MALWLVLEPPEDSKKWEAGQVNSGMEDPYISKNTSPGDLIQISKHHLLKR